MALSTREPHRRTLRVGTCARKGGGGHRGYEGCQSRPKQYVPAFFLLLTHAPLLNVKIMPPLTCNNSK